MSLGASIQRAFGETCIKVGNEVHDEAQRERVEDALASTRGNVTAAARLLRVPLRTFKDRIRRFDVDVAAFRVRPTQARDSPTPDRRPTGHAARARTAAPR